MKLRVEFLIIIFIMLYNITPNVVISKSSKFLKILKNTKWEFYRGLCLNSSKEAEILFKENGKVKTNKSYGENLTIIDGYYELKNNKILLFYIEGSQHTDQSQSKTSKDEMKKTVCTYKEDSNGLLYNSFIKCSNSYYFYNKNDKTKINQKRIVDNVSVITLGYKTAITTSNVRIRRKPSVNAQVIEYNSEEYGKKPYVPKGVKITVIARTTKKMKIGKWNNYWYYVNVFDYFSDNWVWMYGEFINFK
jgi:hypothetical protein